jgi:hypothetical protein
MAALLRVAVSRAVSASRRSTGLYLYKKIVRTVNQNASVLVCRPISTSLNFREKVIPFILPDIGEGIKEVQVLEWFVKEGDKVAEFDDICEVQSDKAAVKITSRYDGVVKKIHYDVDTIATVGAPLVDISVEGDGDATPTHDQQSTTPTPTPKQQKDSSTPAAGKVLATPAVRRIAAENNVRNQCFLILCRVTCCVWLFHLWSDQLSNCPCNRQRWQGFERGHFVVHRKIKSTCHTCSSTNTFCGCASCTCPYFDHTHSPNCCSRKDFIHCRQRGAN